MCFFTSFSFCIILLFHIHQVPSVKVTCGLYHITTLEIDSSTLIINKIFISFEWINPFNYNESDISLQAYKNITTSIHQFSSRCCHNFFASSEVQKN